MTKNGIMCEINNKKIFLDPKNTDSSGVNFVSHAHMDHLPSKNGGTILAQLKLTKLQIFEVLKCKIM